MNNLLKGDWIKLHRKLLTSLVFDNEKMLKVWVWALLKAQHRPTTAMLGYQPVTLRPGEFVFGRIAAAGELKMHESTVYRSVVQLVKLGNLNIKSTNKFSIISIPRWSLYQAGEQQKNNKRTTDEQQKNTYKNEKNVNNEKNVKTSIDSYRNVIGPESVGDILKKRNQQR